MIPEQDCGSVSPKRTLCCALLLICVSVLAYLPAGSNDFVDFDDGAYVTQNPIVQEGLSGEGLRWAFAETHSSNWHPLTWLSHMLDCQLFGLEPRGHHLMAVGLHAVAAALCFLALLVLTKQFWPALLVATFFALHPQRVESVAWISERKDVLSGIFFFGCLLAYGLYAQRGGKLYYICLLASLALGLLAKQMLVTLPCLLLVLDGWPLGRFSERGIKRCLLEKLPLFGLVIAASWMTIYAQSKGGAISTLEALPLDVRVANALWATAAYMGQMLWPTKLAFFYPHPYLVQGDAYSIWSRAEIASALLVLGISAAALLLRKKLPWLLSGWLWYLGLLLPVVGIVHVGAQSMADRYAYLTTIGLYIAIIWSVAEMARGAALRRGLLLGGFALALAMLPVTRAQIATWKDSPALFEHAIATTEANYIAHSNYGFYLQKRGLAEQAEPHYLAALEVAPRLVDAHSNLGAIYIDRKQWELAREKLQAALRIKPTFMDALMLMGLLEESTDNLEAALEVYARASRTSPGYALALSSHARLNRQLGRPELALQLLQKAQGSARNAPEYWIELLRTQTELGLGAQAKSSLESGLGRYPMHAQLRVAGAYFLASHRDRGLRDAGRAQGLLRGMEASKQWRTLRARAAALAAAGDFRAARALALDAVVKAPKHEQPALNQTYQLYKEGKLSLQ
jgi:tetratricopeptide (TPR) repeat protein